MNLRTEIRAAVDEVTPPAPRLASEVEDFVSANARRRFTSRPYRMNRWRSAMRGSLALVAVLIVIALVTSVFVGGRLIHDWNAAHKPIPATPTHATLAQLEARPLQLPHLAAGATCPGGPQSAVLTYGNGPFYGDAAIAQGPTRSQWGLYWYLEGETDKNVSGLLLVRAIDVKTRQSYVFAGQYAAGPVIGTDALGTQAIEQRSELVLDTAHRPSTTYNGKTTWPFELGVPKGNSGCYGWQIDGDNFTETFVFDAGLTS